MRARGETAALAAIDLSVGLVAAINLIVWPADQFTGVAGRRHCASDVPGCRLRRYEQPRYG